jgi:Alpha/beta hydrolase family
MKYPAFGVTLICLLIVNSCSTTTRLPDEKGLQKVAVAQLRAASKTTISDQERALLYLDSACEASQIFDNSQAREAARIVYNKACEDLVILLRSSTQGTLWNRPLTLQSAGKAYQLRFAKGTKDGVWDPSWFTAFVASDTVDLKTIQRRNRIDGIGGALVGIRKTSPLESFTPYVGVTAPVTATLEFQGRVATLRLIDPTEQTKARIAGKERTLQADFSAPLGYYPQPPALLEGLMGALRVEQKMSITGLYMLQPYDPDRIPLIFVHGLISTPRVWRNVINEIETDPILRKRYQCWAFAYPTGNPVLYSALRLREELAKVQQRYPDSKDMVLVGHSMGGLLSRMQVTNVSRSDWDTIGQDTAKTFFSRVKKGSLIERGLLFQANPHVDRAIFVCTPHRGSEIAIGSIGELAIKLIALPSNLASNITNSMGDSIAIVTGNPNRLPTSIDGLSPTNPTLKMLDKRPMTVPHHSIIGDRGKGDTPNSSDGVVKYWSSQLTSAKSEKIVPGPHSSCELPETVSELQRILLLHLNQN